MEEAKENETPVVVDEKETQARAVATIIEDGIPFTVTVDRPNILHKLGILPTRRQFVLRPVKLGTLLKISAKIMSMEEIDVGDGTGEVSMLDIMLKSVVSNTDTMVEIIVLAVENDGGVPSGRFMKFLKDNLTPVDMMKILVNVMRQMDLNGFFSSIVSARGMNILKKKRPAPILTSGESSEVLSSTTDSDGMKSSGGEAG